MAKRHKSEITREVWKNRTLKDRLEIRRKITESLQEVWKKPEYRKKRAATRAKPSVKKKISEIQKKSHATLEYRQKMATRSSDQVYRKKISDGVRKSLEVDPSIRKRRSAAMKKKWKDSQYRKNVAEGLKKAGERPGFFEKRNSAISTAHQKPESRQKSKIGQVRRYSRPGEREKTGEAIKKGWDRKLGTTKRSYHSADKERDDPRCDIWAKNVKRRDNFTCQDCKVRGGILESHHIKSWARHPELRFELTNGITLCEECHKKANLEQRHAERLTCKIR